MKNLTVADALEKVCPFMSEGSARISGVGTVGRIQNCIAGGCMAWHYSKTHEQIENPVSLRDRLTKNDEKISEDICMSQYVDGDELADNLKEGSCLRLRR